MKAVYLVATREGGIWNHTRPRKPPPHRRGCALHAPPPTPPARSIRAADTEPSDWRPGGIRLLRDDDSVVIPTNGPRGEPTRRAGRGAVARREGLEPPTLRFQESSKPKQKR